MSTVPAKPSDGRLKVAGEVVALLGAAVASVYLLGGLVVPVRL